MSKTRAVRFRATDGSPRFGSDENNRRSRGPCRSAIRRTGEDGDEKERTRVAPRAFNGFLEIIPTVADRSKDMLGFIVRAVGGAKERGETKAALR